MLLLWRSDQPLEEHSIADSRLDGGGGAKSRQKNFQDSQFTRPRRCNSTNPPRKFKVGLDLPGWREVLRGSSHIAFGFRRGNRNARRLNLDEKPAARAQSEPRSARQPAGAFGTSTITFDCGWGFLDTHFLKQNLTGINVMRNIYHLVQLVYYMGPLEVYSRMGYIQARAGESRPETGSSKSARAGLFAEAGLFEGPGCQG
jgi:hypothetical protein